MKASRTMVAIVVFAMLVGGAGAIWVYRDYHQWLALGPGGLPYNFHGWMATTWMRRLKRDPLDTSHFAIGSPGDRFEPEHSGKDRANFQASASADILCRELLSALTAS
jgi:hypothetical protein